MATPTRSGASATSAGSDGAASACCISDELAMALDRVSVGNPSRRGTRDIFRDGAARSLFSDGDEFLVAFGSVSTGSRSRSRRGTPASSSCTASTQVADDHLALALPFSASSRTGGDRGGTPLYGDISGEFVMELDSASTGSRTPASASAGIPDDLLALEGFFATSSTGGGGGTPSSADIPDELVMELDGASTGSRTREATAASTTLNTTAVSPSTIADLPEHLLQVIMRVLPDCSSIFSAAFVCHSWHRLISSPANRGFLHEILGSHPPPLLGFYLELGPPQHLRFTPVAPVDPIVSGVLERGDFLLDHLPKLQEGEGPNPAGWEVMDCQEGLLLLSWSETGDIAVYDPFRLSVAYVDTPQFVHHHAPIDLHLVGMKDLKRVVCVCHMDGSIVEISVCDVFDRLGWKRIGRVETAEPWSRTDTRAVQAGGRLFWPFVEREKICQFDVLTSSVSWIVLPPQSLHFTIGFSDDQQMRLVSALRSTVCVWQQSGDVGDNLWSLKTFSLSSIFATLFGSPLETHSDLMVLAVHHDFVYVCALQYLEAPDSPWIIFSLSMMTGDIQMIIETDQFAERVHPVHLRVTA